MEIESQVTRKTLQWLLNESPDRAQTLRELEQLTQQSAEWQGACQLIELFCKRDSNRLTCADRWAAAGFPTLKNDERVIQRATMQMRLRLVEVHRILDELQVEGMDLLESEPTPFLICNRSLVANVCRFTTLLGWFYPLPHFWRSMGVAVVMPAMGSFEPQDVVAEIVRHLGGPAAREGWEGWLANNFKRFSDAVKAVERARHEQVLADTDVEFGKAVYELCAPFAQCRDALDAIRAVAREDLTPAEEDDRFVEGRVWFDESPEFEMKGITARPLLGRVLLGQAHWRLQAIGAHRLARMRSQFEQALGHKVRFCSETKDDLRAHLDRNERKFDPALVPPTLLEDLPKIVFFFGRDATACRGRFSCTP